MNFNTEIHGMTFFRGSVGKSGVRRLALAEVFIPELQMHIRGVQLTWTPGKGYAAQSPSALIHGAVYAIGWNIKSEFARDLAAKMVKMFEAMGGVLPDAQPTPLAAAKAGEIERRVFPFTLVSIDGKPVGDDEPEGEDDTSGLRTFLGVDAAVAETMDRAGL